MKHWSIVFLTVILFSAFFAQTVSGTMVTSSTFTGNYGVQVSAFAGYRADGTASGTLSLSGIPGTASIVNATLYGNWYEFQGSLPSLSAKFGSAALGDVAPFDFEINRSDFRVGAYRWDVTSLVSGNGSVTAEVKGNQIQGDTYGLALVVVYSDPSLPYSMVTINHGAVDLTGPEKAETTFSSVLGDGTLWIHTFSDNGDLPDLQGQSEEKIRFNGQIVGGPIDGNLGDFASLFQLPVATQEGLNKLSIFTPGDQFGWDLAVLQTQPAPIPEPATLILLGSGLMGLAGFPMRFGGSRQRLTKAV